MKKFIILSIFLYIASTTHAQTYSSYLATAQTAYTSGKLDDAQFALQQAIAEIDILTGKKVLTILPAQMGTMTVNTKDDNVFANVGFVGATIHRTWGQGTATADLEIIDNSPMISTLNTFLNMPFGGMMNSSTSKMEKVQGYKGRLNTDGAGTVAGTSNYTLQIPLNTALITFSVKNTTDAQILSLANSLPLAQIAKLIQ
jgi:hypothetical protein